MSKKVHLYDNMTYWYSACHQTNSRLVTNDINKVTCEKCLNKLFERKNKMKINMTKQTKRQLKDLNVGDIFTVAGPECVSRFLVIEQHTDIKCDSNKIICLNLESCYLTTLCQEYEVIVYEAELNLK